MLYVCSVKQPNIQLKTSLTLTKFLNVYILWPSTVIIHIIFKIQLLFYWKRPEPYSQAFGKYSQTGPKSAWIFLARSLASEETSKSNSEARNLDLIQEVWLTPLFDTFFNAL